MRQIMTKCVAPLVVLLMASVASESAAEVPNPEQASIAWTLSGQFCEPETVLPLPDETFLVSNVCDFKTKGNGFLSLINAEGEVLDWRAVQSLDAPLGMARVDNRLYVVDSNTVREFEWPGFKPVAIHKLDTKVANDIAVAPDHTIYVSDSATHQVIKLDSDGTQSVLTNSARFKHANGMALDGNHLYVGGARLWCVNLSSGAVTTIGPKWLEDIDGIEFERDGTLQVTIVGGPLVRLPLGEAAQVLGGDGVSSTNHGYYAKKNLSLIPTGYDNTVVAVRVPR